MLCDRQNSEAVAVRRTVTDPVRYFARGEEGKKIQSAKESCETCRQSVIRSCCAGSVVLYTHLGNTEVTS